VGVGVGVGVGILFIFIRVCGWMDVYVSLARSLALSVCVGESERVSAWATLYVGVLHFLHVIL
jgi:hypothetical protein